MRRTLPDRIGGGHPPSPCLPLDTSEHVFDTGGVGEPVHRQPGWSPGQRILNDTGARQPEHTFHRPVPIVARVIWEDDGEEHLETVALGWAGRDVYVRMTRGIACGRCGSTPPTSLGNDGHRRVPDNVSLRHPRRACLKDKSLHVRRASCLEESGDGPRRVSQPALLQAHPSPDAVRGHLRARTWPLKLVASYR
jgi:hypothetical protein